MKRLKQKPFATISLLSVFALCFAIAIVRWINVFNKDIYVITKTINSHITNFAISVMLCTLIGYVLLLTGKKYGYSVITGAVLVAANLVYEIFLPMVNTTDIVDAVYGCVGVAVSLVYLYILSKFGFIRE